MSEVPDEPVRRSFADVEPSRSGRFATRAIELDGRRLVRVELAPGARWSEDVGPVRGQRWCQQPHTIAVLEGSAVIEMSEGTTIRIGPSDVIRLPAGHDAWNENDTTCVLLEL